MGPRIDCAVCAADLSALEVGRRAAHVEACLGARAPRAAAGDDTLDRLDDCPVCGAAWAAERGAPRVAHARACAAQHGLTAGEFAALVDMFRESLGGSRSEHSGASAPRRARARPIDGWLGRRGSSSGAASQSSEAAEDEDFQAARARAPRRQAAISVRRVGKKAQAALDELDDDLNEAKALSLSLTREPRAEAVRAPTGRRAAELLARSDILAGEEAQSYIRQRAMALERMDEERAARAGGHGPTREARGDAAGGGGGELWAMGSQVDAPYRPYCPMFEGYRVRAD
ncbi:hypothetical protein H4R18_000856 [Coemansia javaensis]|uniref:UBZ4-type domain-containing protein n=1 Tax=Coemansia javaensis TaxID=2761396 RepID=A0A9W8LL53_9FUNG|nr:hypothetical protein H4R18_000856 [Coemansia javaensis]